MKKSVLFYSDWYEILKELPDDERVRAYDAIMQFAFEDVEPTDKYIKAITALIIKGIINNRNQYEEICERNRQKALKRWGRTNTNNAVAHKSIQKHTSGCSGIQVNTNDTSGCYNDNDNDNDNDNELANANNINKEIKENIKKENKESQASFIDEYFAKTTFIESFCMQNHTTPEEMRTMAEAIIIEWDAAGVRHANYTEAHNHLTSTLRIRVRDSKRNNMQVDNRPPRPSVHHIWSESQQKWVYSI